MIWAELEDEFEDEEEEWEEEEWEEEVLVQEDIVYVLPVEQEFLISPVFLAILSPVPNAGQEW